MGVPQKTERRGSDVATNANANPQTPQLPPPPVQAAPKHTEVEQRLVDGTCLTCTGITHFTQSMAAAREPARCIGLTRLLRVPPPPFTFAADVEAAAKRRDGAMRKRHPAGTERAYEVTFGVSCVTSKMEVEGVAPVKVSGVTIAAYGTAGDKIPSPPQLAQQQLEREQQQQQQQQQQGKAKSGLAAEAQTQQTPGAAPLSSNLSELMRGGDPGAVAERVSSVAADLWATRVLPVVSWTVDFWKPEAPWTYPERYVNFTYKYFNAMGAHVQKSAKFGQKMVNFWLPSTGGNAGDS
jgi:hypothetical protein